MKKKKFMTSLMLMSLLVSMTTSSVSAISTVVQPRGPICTPTKYYEPTSTKTDIIINKTGEFRNNTSEAQTKSISCSTTYKTEVSAATEAEFKLITSKLNVSAKIGVGKSKTETITSTFKIPAYTIGYYKIGQKKKNTKGNIVTLNGDCITTKKYVTAKYSFSEYDDIDTVKIK